MYLCDQNDDNKPRITSTESSSFLIDTFVQKGFRASSGFKKTVSKTVSNRELTNVRNFFNNHKELNGHDGDDGDDG
jgi:hypothetical protein